MPEGSEWLVKRCLTCYSYPVEEVIKITLDRRTPSELAAELAELQQYRAMKAEVEKGAEIAHSQWSGWMQYLFGKCTVNDDGTVTMPKWAVDRWTRQMNTEYADLPEEEKASDREEAQRYINWLTPEAAEAALEAAKEGAE